MTFTKKILSGSTEGLPIKVVATATAGTLIHTGPSSAAILHEIWLWAHNTSAADVILTLEYGGATVPDQNIIQTVKAKAGEALLIPGLLLQGNATPKTIKAFAAIANVITITGFVNEIA